MQGPEVALAILHPFEIRDRHAPCVSQNIGDHEDAFFLQNLVCGERSGTVGAFADNAGLDAVRVMTGDLILGGSGEKDVAIGAKQLAGIVGLGSRKPYDRPGMFLVIE